MAVECGAERGTEATPRTRQPLGSVLRRVSTFAWRSASRSSGRPRRCIRLRFLRRHQDQHPRPAQHALWKAADYHYLLNDSKARLLVGRRRSRSGEDPTRGICPALEHLSAGGAGGERQRPERVRRSWRSTRCSTRSLSRRRARVLALLRQAGAGSAPRGAYTPAARHVSVRGASIARAYSAPAGTEPLLQRRPDPLRPTAWATQLLPAFGGGRRPSIL